MILKIKNHYVLEFFNKLSFTWKYDAVASTFAFSMYFDPDDANHKELLKPGHFHQCTVEHNGETLLTGFLMNQTFTSRGAKQLSSVSGYSLPGVLEDCNIPVSLYPLQSDNLSLKEIADKLLQPFGVKYLVSPAIVSDFNKKYKKSNAMPGQSIKEYINQLASQRGIVLTHDDKGQLIFTKVDAKTLKLIAVFEEGNPGINEISLQLNGQMLHSEITVMKQASDKNPDAGESTISNPYVDAFRPKIKIQSSGDIFDIEKAARSVLGAELQAIKLNLQTLKFVAPGNLIKFKSESVGINRLTDFFVQETGIIGTPESEVYNLSCVLKDVYTQDTVKNIFK